MFLKQALKAAATWRTNVLTLLKQALKAGYIADLSLETGSGKFSFGNKRESLRLLVLEEAVLSPDREIPGAYDTGLAAEW